ncbi:MAG: hypothetical protein SO164_02025 [Campylobacter sp.]|nr:hypothetical protein [Campylobacter sp.]
MRSNLYKNFSEIASVALLPRNDGYLMRLLRFARNDENSRIPYRDPQSGWGMTQGRRGMT